MRLDPMYPKVAIPTDPTYASLRLLARNDPNIATALILVDRGEWTQEQALVAIIFWQYDHKRRLHDELVARAMCEVKPIVIVNPLSD